MSDQARLQTYVPDELLEIIDRAVVTLRHERGLKSASRSSVTKEALIAWLTANGFIKSAP